ncbi:MAG: S8 family serine peptidase [bacterium]
MFRHRAQFFAFAILSVLILTSSASPKMASKGPATGEIRYLKQRVVPEKPKIVKIASNASLRYVVVKFQEGSSVRLRGNNLTAEANHVNSAKQAEKLLAPYINGQFERHFKVKSEHELERARTIAEASSKHQLADLNLYYRIQVNSAAEGEDLVNHLNQLDIVEIAYIEPVPEPAGDIAPPTPDYEFYQDYLFAAPGGVDAEYAKTQSGGDGTGVKIIDIEFEWTETHEDLEKALGGTIVGGGAPYGDHGTAVIGEMIAGDNGYGVTGICPGADIGMVSVATISTAEAILVAADNLQPGDLILIELHAPGPHYNFQVRSDQRGYVCMEYWQDNFDAIQYAWAKGVIVVEAAGNGAENFDDPLLYGQLFDTTYRNSHAIIVGAGAPPSGAYGTDRSRLSFSNYGERVNLQGYGAGVYTTGYGGLFDGGGDYNQHYTASFSGTSSASPIVTGAVACLQGHYKATFGVPMTADAARNLLYATGSPQQGLLTQHIGPRPDLAAAFPAIAPPSSLYSNPIYIDTSVEGGTMVSIPVWLHNRSASTSLDFNLVGNDSLPKMAIGNWLNASPSVGSVPALDSVAITVTIDATVIPTSLTRYKGIIEISWGQSGNPLDSMLYLPVFLTVPCAPDTTFAAKSSNDSGPAFNWIDITGIGTLIPKNTYYNTFSPTTPLDDGSAGPFNLPFTFKFFGNSYTQFYVGVNGAISFTDSEVNSNGYFSGFNIPGNPFSTFISAFWNDLTIDSVRGGHGNIYFYFSPTHDTAIIEWYRVGNFNSASDTLTTFEIILTKRGDIMFQYLSVGNSGLQSTALIGLSAIDCQASPYLDNSVPANHLVGNADAVLFERQDLVMAGDANNNGITNILDATYLLAYMYRSGPAPIQMEAGDVNCSGAINILDVTALIGYLYKSGAEPCYY